MRAGLAQPYDERKHWPPSGPTGAALQTAFLLISKKVPSDLLASVSYSITNRTKAESDNEVVWATYKDWGTGTEMSPRPGLPPSRILIPSEGSSCTRREDTPTRLTRGLTEQAGTSAPTPFTKGECRVQVSSHL